MHRHGPHALDTSMTLWRRVSAVLLVVFATACRNGPSADEAGDVQEGVGGELLVSAAASLANAFAEIETSFEAAQPGVNVVLNLGGSSALRTQILEGAPVDVFASADVGNMNRVVEAGEVSGEPRVFARNRLRIAVPVGNPGGVAGLDDFGDERLLLGLCTSGVPCGDFAREVLARAGVVAALDTNEPDVRALLTKIELGELDAGITYVTDVTSAGGRVEGIDIPDELNVLADYPIAVLTGAQNPRAGEAFVGFVLSDEGRGILAKHGFTLP